MAAPAVNSLPLEQISLRQRDRAAVLGGVDSGKSTLMDMLGTDFVARYHRQGARRLILDSKPRYRAQFTARGLPARRRYRGWSHGQAIPGSVVVDGPDELELAWSTGATTVIAQCQSSNDIPRLVAVAHQFLKSSKASRPQLAQIDETLDFYHSNGMPRGGDDTITQLARAGRERGTATMYGSQRTKGLAATLMAEFNRLYCLVMDYQPDIRRLQECGCPPFEMPQDPHVFRYWYKANRSVVWGPYKLALS